MAEDPLRGPIVFKKEDYAAAPRRIAAAAVDLLAILLIYVGLWLGVSVFRVPADVRRMSDSPERQRAFRKHMAPVAPYVSLTWLASIFAYHVGLRRTRGGTPGHRLLGHRLVDAYGETPSTKSLFKRFLIAAPLVPMFGLPYLACARTKNRQAFHDTWCGTYVVRKNAASPRSAKLTYQTQMLGTFLMTQVDVEPADEADS